MNKKTRNIIIAVAVLLVLVIGALLIYNAARPEAQKGGKNIVVTVVHADGSEKEFKISTDAETLRAALEEQKLIEGTEGDLGLYVETVDGEKADYSANESWWRFTKDGVDTDAVDAVMIADGDHYEITYTIGYDLG